MISFLKNKVIPYKILSPIEELQYYYPEAKDLSTTKQEIIGNFFKYMGYDQFLTSSPDSLVERFKSFKIMNFVPGNFIILLYILMSFRGRRGYQINLLKVEEMYNSNLYLDCVESCSSSLYTNRLHNFFNDLCGGGLYSGEYVILNYGNSRFILLEVFTGVITRLKIERGYLDLLRYLENIPTRWNNIAPSRALGSRLSDKFDEGMVTFRGVSFVPGKDCLLTYVDVNKEYWFDPREDCFVSKYE